ncbi:hypothetical protein F5146DRAFT_1069628 [Armillaria mellea]|nr:hypothetical protein F5146DRAFT_1069628 [Armillaria mellea]
MSIEVGGLYIILSARYQKGSYHWGLYHHWSDPVPGTDAPPVGNGTKYHAITLGQEWGRWQVEKKETARTLQSLLLVGLIEIGHIDSANRQWLEATIDKVTCTSPSPDITFNCRVWVLKAVNHLIDAGVVRCESVKALETEAIVFGNQHASTCPDRPRPVVQSSVCKL